MPDFDLVVLGTGAAGLTAAAEAAKHGAKIALVGNDRPGGDCSYYGCVPTKTLIRAAKIWHYMQRAEDFGLPRTKARLDYALVVAAKDRIVDQITKRGSWDPWEKKGFAVFKGTGRFVSSHEIQVDGAVVRGDKIVIAVGSEPLVPPIPGLAEAGYITNVQAVALRSLPGRLLVLGAGPIGMEFAQLFGRFGVKVTVVEMDRPLPNEDQEVVSLLCDYLAEEGIEIRVGARLERVERKGAAKVAYVTSGRRKMQIAVDEILVATGRRPPTQDIGLDRAGVGTVDSGWIKVHTTLRTTARNIWAAGDCTGGFMFTHVADIHGRVIAHNLFAGAGPPARVDYRVLPWVTFTDPELARIGPTEEQARELGLKVRSSTFRFADLERSRLIQEPKGVIKVIARSDGRILGATVLGTHADDLIHEFAVAIKAGLKTHDVLSMIHAYPTLSEGVRWSMWAFEPEKSTGV